ncbi:hypothetical protein QZH41_008803, partial [Actinostola sp. cb2023]
MEGREWRGESEGERVITNLKSLSSLEQLSIAGNPCLLALSNFIGFNYRPFILFNCPRLRNLDGHLISQGDRRLEAEKLRSDGQLRTFSPGRHLQLVKYLTQATPLGHSTSRTPTPTIDRISSQADRWSVPVLDEKPSTEAKDLALEDVSQSGKVFNDNYDDNDGDGGEDLALEDVSQSGKVFNDNYDDNDGDGGEDLALEDVSQSGKVFNDNYDDNDGDGGEDLAPDDVSQSDKVFKDNYDDGDGGEDLALEDVSQSGKVFNDTCNYDDGDGDGCENLTLEDVSQSGKSGKVFNDNYDDNDGDGGEDLALEDVSQSGKVFNDNYDDNDGDGGEDLALEDVSQSGKVFNDNYDDNDGDGGEDLALEDVSQSGKVFNDNYDDNDGDGGEDLALEDVSQSGKVFNDNYDDEDGDGYDIDYYGLVHEKLLCNPDKTDMEGIQNKNLQHQSDYSKKRDKNSTIDITCEPPSRLISTIDFLKIQVEELKSEKRNREEKSYVEEQIDPSKEPRQRSIPAIRVIRPSVCILPEFRLDSSTKEQLKNKETLESLLDDVDVEIEPLDIGTTTRTKKML